MSIRERWAQLTNQGLQQAGLASRVDHRSYKRQGINREPALTLPDKVRYAEQKARAPSPIGDAYRARRRERVEARLKGSDELARVVERQKAEAKERALADLKRQEAQPKRVRWRDLSREERNKRQRELYRDHRAIAKLDPATQQKMREASNARYYARMRENPEAVREYGRRWRKAHAQELNQRRRETRSANAEQENLKQREYRQRKAERDLSKSTPPTVHEATRNGQAYRDNHGPRPTADESARNGLAFRERQKQSELPEPVTPASSMTAAERLRQRSDEVAQRLAAEREQERARQRLEQQQQHAPEQRHRKTLEQKIVRQRELDHDRGLEL